MKVYGIYEGNQAEGFHLSDNTVYMHITDAVNRANERATSEWTKKEDYVWRNKWGDTMKINAIELKK